ncbi:hypothetical protein N7457_003199 [Penicillium paradoxum]|uniref:uncharacterized protein n=1 Tax=Penicillium paradoxum TaxID=176176 RepID=UPI00254660CD|nr:uncharacterized protein N7457_003199 [Penicillium paradoxum]KAJ5788209.1 hypothetical protein N7457_003199 [Penicillium paradoxum]
MFGTVSIFPPELWLMIIEYLRCDENPQHLSRLSQTCQWLHREVNRVMYRSVRLKGLENARSFADTVSTCPELAALVIEVRHADDMGFEDFAHHSEPFYKALPKLENLQNLAMRKDFRPSDRYTPQGAINQVLSAIYLARDDDNLRISTLLDIMEKLKSQGYPLGSEDDPFGLGFNPLSRDFNLKDVANDLVVCTYFARDNLTHLTPALRTCHIGTDSHLPDLEQHQPSIDFNESIFTLPQLEKLCITGAIFYEAIFSEEHAVGCAASLKELLILNCRISAASLEYIIQFPRALERLTLRGPITLESPYQEDDYGLFTDQLRDRHTWSLKYLDLDFYGGSQLGPALEYFDVLEEVIVTPGSLGSVHEGEIILPDCLERLTLRYEEGKALRLPALVHELETDTISNLCTVVCQIPENLCESTTSKLRLEVESFKSRFKDFKVDLSWELVPYPTTMPKYDICPCENLQYYHQSSCHPLVEPLSSQDI